MLHDGFVQARHPSRSIGLPTNNRGAVFLLAVYLSALALLLLGGISLQRTNIDLRAAQISRDMHQGFWLAEGALDYALAHVKTVSTVKTTGGVEQPLVLDGIEYTVPTVQGTATFSVETVSATLLSPTQQLLVRRVTAKGQGVGVKRSIELSSYYTEQGPLQGVWGRAFVIAAGGKNFPTVFLTGSMRSNRAALAATVESNLLKLDGLGLGKDYDEVLSHASEDLLSVKEGYKLLNGIQLGRDGDDVSKAQFVGEAQEASIPHVEGAVSVGMVTEPIRHVKFTDANLPLLAPFPQVVRDVWSPLLCAGTLNVANPGGHPKEISDGFAELSNGRLIMDLSPKAGEVTLCVNAIKPATDQMWLDTLLDNPPKLLFHQPTTIYVTGSELLDVTNLSFALPSDTMIAPGFVLRKGMILPSDVLPAVGIHTQWNVSVGAKFSAVDAGGRTIPNGVHIIMTNPRPAWPPSSPVVIPGGKPAGVVWVKPDRFSGSVYAPDSLVIVRARDVASRDPSEQIELQNVVGNEVIVELEAERSQIGKINGLAMLNVDTTVLSWSAEKSKH